MRLLVTLARDSMTMTHSFVWERERRERCYQEKQSPSNVIERESVDFEGLDNVFKESTHAPGHHKHIYSLIRISYFIVNQKVDILGLEV